MTIKKYAVTIDGQTYQVTLEELSEPQAQAATKTSMQPNTFNQPPSSKNEHSVFAPMAGTILKIVVKVGETVKKGETLCVLEAMKMENQIVAPVDGIVSSIPITEGQGVESSQLLIVI